MRRIIAFAVTFTIVWLSFATWYLSRGMARQHSVQEALAVFRSADAKPEDVAAAQKRLLGQGTQELSLLYLVQELNQEEHRNQDMRLCRGLSRLLARRQEHAAANAAGRLLDATFMWPHVRHIPDLVIQLRKTVILEPTRRARAQQLIKDLNGLCLKREIDLTTGQRELVSRALTARLEQNKLPERELAAVDDFQRLLSTTPADAPLRQTYERWKTLTQVVRSLKASPTPGQDDAKALDALQTKALKAGPQSSFIVTAQHRKFLSNTLQRLRDHETKWKQKRGLTSSTLRFEPTSMEELQDFVERVKDTGMLAHWQTALVEPFAQSAKRGRLELKSLQAHLLLWQSEANARDNAREELCLALDKLRRGERKLADITRQAALYCLTGWQPRNGLEGAPGDSLLSRLQDFMWSEREWLPEDLKQSPSIVQTICDKARTLRRQARSLRMSILAKSARAGAALTSAEADYLALEARTWREVARLPALLDQVIQGEAAPLDEMTDAQRAYLALKCLRLQDRYRRGRRQVAVATRAFAEAVVKLADGKFARRTQGEEVGNLRAIFSVWRQRDEEMLTGDLTRLLQNPFPEVRSAARRALEAIGRAGVPALEDIVSRREINQLMAVETAELSKEDHTKLLERQLRTGRSEAGRTLAAIGAAVVRDLRRKGTPPDEDADVVRIRRALHNALNDPSSGLRELEGADPDLHKHLIQLDLLKPDGHTAATDAPG